MHSTELIRKFPENPQRPILYVVYNEHHIYDAKHFISTIHGIEYFEEHVEIVTFNEENPGYKHDFTKYDVYVDPTVYKYKMSWNN